MTNIRRKVFHEPVAPYFADTYNTLLSVVQGVALAGLLYIFTTEYVEHQNTDILFHTKLFVVCAVIVAIWHRYVTHDQYLAWRLGVSDTLIPIVFGALQVMLSVFASRRDPFYFSAVYTVILFWGGIAYENARRKHKRDHTKKIYEEHFDGNDSERKIGTHILTSIKKFENSQRNMFFILGIISLTCTITMHITKKYILTNNIMLFFLCLMTFYFLFSRDLKAHFHRDPIIGKICD